MPAVKMYTTAVCPYCVRAKQLLQAKGVAHIEEVRVDLNPDERVKMMQWFADWCDAKATGKSISNVTKLKVA